MRKIQLDTEKIKKMYSDGYTLSEIANHFGYKTYKSVRTILHNEGVNLKLKIGSRSRTKSLDENYFSIIDTPNKAYILGWIISDGYVSKGKLVFGLKDIEIIQFIKNELKSEHKINDSLIYDKRTGKFNRQYRIQICSKKLSEDLNKLGIHQAKSFTAQLPKIDTELLPHLVRGLFEGDGYIGEGKYNNGKSFPRFSIILSEKLYHEISPILELSGIKLKKPSIVAEKDGNHVLKLHIYKKKDLRIFFNYIYNDEKNFILKRKYEKFKQLLGESKNDPKNNYTINQYDLSGNLLNTFYSIRQVSVVTGINKNKVFNDIIKKRIEIFQGFRWEVTQ